MNVNCVSLLRYARARLPRHLWVSITTPTPLLRAHNEGPNLTCYTPSGVMLFSLNTDWRYVRNLRRAHISVVTTHIPCRGLGRGAHVLLDVPFSEPLRPSLRVDSAVSCLVSGLLFCRNLLTEGIYIHVGRSHSTSQSKHQSLPRRLRQYTLIVNNAA